MVTLKLFDFQEKASLKLIDLVSNIDSKQTILMKAPTGSGKTIILIDFVDKYLSNIDSNFAFIWLCPGKGDLEEQSREKMTWVAPDRKTQDLNEALIYGFESGTTTFINWELVTKKGNRAISEGEKKTLFDRIADAHRKGIEFIIIIDEEHQNNTSKADYVINAFSAKNIIRTSATVLKRANIEYVEIDETEVIASGLITRAIYVNEGVTDNINIDDDYDILLKLAEQKREEIYSRYRKLDKNIRPLVLIQFPNGQPRTIELVENKLEQMGYTYDNGMVAIWMSDRKENIDENFGSNEGTPIFLLMKQAISTGWDCPRAKILVKLREGMNEQFEIQTVGRIRRMPEARHYEDDILDFCYVYTFDEKYKEGLFDSVEKSYETRRLFLKEKCKTVSLIKQTRDLDFAPLGQKELFLKIRNFFIDKYKLTRDKEENKVKLEANGYVFGDELLKEILKGKFVKTGSLANREAQRIVTKTQVNTHKHSLYLLHTIDALKKIISIEHRTLQTIFNRLFRKGYISGQGKILSLPIKEFYAFVINNTTKFKEDFRELVSMSIGSEQKRIVFSPKQENFKIPEMDLFKYDPGVKNEKIFESNAYKDYTTGNVTSLVRSMSEILFEKHCEERSDIDWVYKNGDVGSQYFSIVYVDNTQKQWLFYVDYIVRKTDGTIWLIETKGGEFKGESKNIDRNTENKFLAFKKYAEEFNIQWGFVRDKDGELYINNTEYHEEMSNENWLPLKDKF